MNEEVLYKISLFIEGILSQGYEKKMNETIQTLAEICNVHRFREKLLFVPSYSIGNQIGKYLAKMNVSWINLRMTTTAGYAQQLVSPDLGREGIRLMDPQELIMIIEELYRRDRDPSKKECYFGGVEEVPGIIKCLGNAIHEMRMAGLDHEGIDPGAFIVHKKGEELARLLVSYHAFLSENRLIDHAGLIRLAIDRLRKGVKNRINGVVMVLSDFPLAPLEKELILLAGEENLIIVRRTQPVDLDLPGRFFGPPKEGIANPPQPETNIDLLPWLYKPEKAPHPFKDDSVSMFNALGESNEVREVFRRIFKDEILLDDVEIIMTESDPYISLFYEIAASLDVPATFAGGIPVTYTRPGRALVLYLNWQAEDFYAGSLKDLFSGGCLDLDKFVSNGESPSPGRASRIIREAAIGWGQDRYASRFKALEEAFLSKAYEEREEGAEEKARLSEETAGKVAWVACFVERIIKTVPETDPEGEVTTKALCSGALDFLNKFCRVASEPDVAAKARLAEALESLERAPSISGPAKETAERICRMVGSVSVGHSNPRPGHMHIAHYRSGGYSGRHHTFVLGLDQNRFPGVLLQDPVMLDVERQRLGPQLALASQLLEEKLYAMARLLGSLQGKVTLSYSCRDLREDQEIFPASLMLNVYRLITADRNGDYSALGRFLGKPAGFIPDSGVVPLNDWEWWLARKALHYGSDSVHASYQPLFDGEKAEVEREQEKLSAFDGWVPSSAGYMDPITNDVPLSCSRLESLAKCPFAFFIRYVLDIEPLEAMEKDTGRWLNPVQRGDLLHRVFCRFMERLKAEGESPEFERHFPMIENIALEEAERWKFEAPPASELAFKREMEEIRLTLEIFLKDEEARCKGIEPSFFETSFGMGEEEKAGISDPGPVEISLKSKGCFKLTGRIDRIDNCADHDYEVWDYKTGSAFGYKEYGYLNRGWHLQHALYSMATEILLRRKHDKDARVVRAGYFFPGPKGEGLRINKDQTERKELYEVLEDLFELLRTGVFPCSIDKEPCGLCHYDGICGGKEVSIERSQRKLSSDGKMAPLDRLKTHV
jgi:ATP-dependent helicase/nuclease subunit B